MNTFKKMMVGLVGASFLIGAMVPVSAAPIVPGALAATNENIQNVRDRHRGPRHWGGYRPGPRPGWGHRPYRHRSGYWNGHRGYRYYRPGYRRYNDGWWYPLAAFGAGAIVGGALAAPARPVYRAPAYSSSHVQWCYNRYRSYRASDNTFQPYNGPRQQCYSPY